MVSTSIKTTTTYSKDNIRVVISSQDGKIKDEVCVATGNGNNSTSMFFYRDDLASLYEVLAELSNRGAI